MRLTKPEALSYILAERFATKCFTPLELTHFKDNFFSRATDQNGLKYWNEKTLSDFLGIPDSSETECPLDAGPVIFRMVSYLGAFPFQKTLAPSVLTFDAMVKVAVLLTGRYERVLRRGRRDRIRLLFGSLADVGRKDFGSSDQGEENGDTAAKAHPSGYDIDQPANDDEDDEDGDDLALAALESLDAIEVFRHDQRVDRTVYEARISTETFHRLLMLLLVIAPLKILDDVRTYTDDLSAERMETVRNEADNILAAFIEDGATGDGSGISYKSFSKMISNSLPHLFDPLTPLFEHMLFSKNLNMSQKRGRTGSMPSVHTEEQPESDTRVPPSPPPVMLPGAFESVILNPSLISHLSFFLSSTSRGLNFLQSGAQLHPVFSTAAHGSSLTSFSHHVLTWKAPSLMILHGVTEENKTIALGAYLPSPWESSSNHSSSKTLDSTPSLFQLSPKHLILPGNLSSSIHQNTNTPTAYFSTATGLALGCKLPPSSRTSTPQPYPHGAGSLLIDSSLESADFHVSAVGHDGAFLPPATTSTPAEKTHIDIYNLEIWGVVQPDDSSTSAGQGQSAVEVQKAKWEFEAREAERRRNVNLNAGVGDSARESARWLLESAGLVGESGRYGGSV